MQSKKSTGICIHLRYAEKTRKYLSEKKLIRNDLKIEKDEHFIYFPVKSTPKEINSYKVIKKEFKEIEKKPTSYKKIIKIPDKFKQELPTSYDIIGNIILIKLPENLLKYQREIGKALLESKKNIKTVCLVEPVTGEYRTRKIQVIAGEKNTKTIYKEHGLTFELDIKNTYFSPRLATERKRISSLVKHGETIVDMFTGVAPFPVMIAKYANPKIIYAIDKNKHAVEYAKQNTIRNNVLDKIEVINADATDISQVLLKKNVKADRIIMNLPFSAYNFFKNALEIIADTCIIHYYDILKEEEIPERIKNLKKIAEKKHISLENLKVKKIKTYAPREFYIGIDITAKKKHEMLPM
jgi:tRNA (guanine37-N1)-methyltransferase